MLSVHKNFTIFIGFKNNKQSHNINVNTKKLILGLKQKNEHNKVKLLQGFMILIISIMEKNMFSLTKVYKPYISSSSLIF